VKNPRIARQVRDAQQLSDVTAVQQTAQSILQRLDAGQI
jgi:hypothetical protein